MNQIRDALEARLTDLFGAARMNGSGRSWRVRGKPSYSDVILVPTGGDDGARIWVFDPARNSLTCAKCFPIASVETIDETLMDLQAWLGDKIPVTFALTRLLEVAATATGAPMSDVRVYEPEAMALRLLAHRGLPPQFIEHFRIIRPDQDETVCGRAFRRQMPIFVRDVSEQSDYPQLRQIATAVGFRAVHAIPVPSEDHVCGVVTCMYEEPRDPDSEALERIHDYIYCNQRSFRPVLQ